MIQEKRLAFAVLQRAILDAVRVYNYVDPDHRSEAAKDARDAKKWISSKRTDFYSFLWMCETFNLSAPKVRRAIKGLRLGRYDFSCPPLSYHMARFLETDSEEYVTTPGYSPLARRFRD
jgi:hypothetical protein